MITLSLLQYSLWLVFTAVLTTLQIIRMLKWVNNKEDEGIVR